MVASSNGDGGGGGGSSENVKVVVRVRPLNEKEHAADYRSIIHVDSINGSVKLNNLNQARWKRLNFSKISLRKKWAKQLQKLGRQYPTKSSPNSNINNKELVNHIISFIIQLEQACYSYTFISLLQK